MNRCRIIHLDKKTDKDNLVLTLLNVRDTLEGLIIKVDEAIGDVEVIGKLEVTSVRAKSKRNKS